MINSRAEKAAVYATAAVLNDFEWFFHERTTADFGIDAFVELSTSKRPDGRFLALQIKGGNSGLKRGKNGLVFYFPDNHRDYWLRLRMPMLMIAHDQKNNVLYWEKVTAATIHKTGKQWKIELPYRNTLAINAKRTIELFVDEHFGPYQSYVSDETEVHYGKVLQVSMLTGFLRGTLRVKEPALQVSYEMRSRDGKNELCIVLIAGKKQVITKLGYYDAVCHVDDTWWWDHDYYFTLFSLEKYLYYRYAILNTKNALDILKAAIEEMVQQGGMDEIARRMFDRENKLLQVPASRRFLLAFEHATGLDRSGYQVCVTGHAMRFSVGEFYGEMISWQGRIAELEMLIAGKQYDVFFVQTDPAIWNSIYRGNRVNEQEFVAAIRVQWVLYWDRLYTEMLRETGSATHLDDLKNRSWYLLKHFCDTCHKKYNAVLLAAELDDLVLFPLAVMALVELIGTTECFRQYCEAELNGKGSVWEMLPEPGRKRSQLFIRELEQV